MEVWCVEEEVQAQSALEKTLKTADGYHSQHQVEAEWDLGALPRRRPLTLCLWMLELGLPLGPCSPDRPRAFGE